MLNVLDFRRNKLHNILNLLKMQCSVPIIEMHGAENVESIQMVTIVSMLS